MSIRTGKFSSVAFAIVWFMVISFLKVQFGFHQSWLPTGCIRDINTIVNVLLNSNQLTIEPRIAFLKHL